MNILTDLIVVIWLIPVILCIILPLCLKVVVDITGCVTGCTRFLSAVRQGAGNSDSVAHCIKH